MGHKGHRLENDLESDHVELERFLNNLDGRVACIIPNYAKTTLFQIYGTTRKIDFVLIVEAVKEKR